MTIKRWQIFATIFCLIFGTLLHFTYEWFNYNMIIGLFSAVNESTWEHLKLLFYPMFIISIIGHFVIGKKSSNYWLSQIIGISASLIFVVIFFYTYTGIIGKNLMILDISSFVIGILIGEYIMYKILKSNTIYKAELPSIILLIILLLCFIVFTIYPPKIPLFEDPIYGTFGIEPKRID